MFKGTGQSQFDKLFEKATSNLLLEPDWNSIIQICDLIRQKDCQPKYAIAAIKKKIVQPNPHVSMFALQVLESVVKNCGSPVHDEVANKSFMEELREIAKTSPHENVREKILELVQTWAHAFRKHSSYRAVQDVLNIMKAEGCKFPPLVEADAMFVSDTAPEWAEGSTCHRCRTEFGLVNRKHHCRACGQVFCGKCSAKTATLPKFGIEKEVRVCDACFEKVARDGGIAEDSEEMILKSTGAAPSHPPSSHGVSAPRRKTEEELQEEEQLQLAIAISQSEAEAKEREKESWYKFSPVTSASNVEHENRSSNHKGSPVISTAPAMEAEDPELSRYLNRNYWENRQSAKEDEVKDESPRNIAGSKISTNGAVHQTSTLSQFHPSAPVKEMKEKIETPTGEVGSFVDSLRVQIETFVTRMKSNSSRGRHIANDTAVQSLFMNITALHSQLLNFIQSQDSARTYYEGLQDKLSQIRDARAALDALREQHRERLRIKAEEEERAKRFHMAQMLQVKRQQKQEYLEYQRQLTLHRMQEQEREMQMRIEQQKQQLAQQGQFGMYPSGIPGYIPRGNVDMGQFVHPQGNYGPPGTIPGDAHSFSQQNSQRFPPSGPQYMMPVNMPGQGMPIGPNQPNIVHLQQPNQMNPSNQQGMPLEQQHSNSLSHGPMAVNAAPNIQGFVPQSASGAQNGNQMNVNTNVPPPGNTHFQQQPTQAAALSPPSVDGTMGGVPMKEEPSTAELISFD